MKVEVSKVVGNINPQQEENRNYISLQTEKDIVLIEEQNGLLYMISYMPNMLEATARIKSTQKLIDIEL